MLRLLDNVKVAFFIEEETGCHGSNKCNIDFFNNSSFIFQVDRRGCEDFITYTNGTEVSSKEFQDAVKPFIEDYGLKFGNGSSTDVGTLVKRNVGCCCANIGSGYYDPHSLDEKVCLSDLENITNMCYHISNSLSDKRWDFTKPEPKTYSTTSNQTSQNGSGVKSPISCVDCKEGYCVSCPFAADAYLDY